MITKIPSTANFLELSKPFINDTADAVTREQLAKAVESSNNWIIVLDDDPTGSQAVHGMPIINTWTIEDIRWAFGQDKKYFFIQTNLRSLDEVTALRVTTEISKNVSAVAGEFNFNFTFISRGDSTLRGHYPLEVDRLQELSLQTAKPYDLVIFAPSYLEAGRVTLNDIQWVKTESGFVPVSETDYSQDTTFGFTSSNLIDFIQEKSNGRISESAIYSLDLNTIRTLGASGIAQELIKFPHNSTVIVNALTANDLNIVAAASILAENQGRSIVYRAAPSFVAARLGISKRSPLTHAELFPGSKMQGQGLVMVGSHVEITNAQVKKLREELPANSFVELDVSKLMESESKEIEIERCISALGKSLDSQVSIFLTSRIVLSGNSREKSLEISNQVASALIEVAESIINQKQISWVIAKGGITSNDILTKVFKMTRATVLGQLFQGFVSVFRSEMENSKFSTEIPVVVFAGNVGKDESLVEAIKVLQGTQ